MQSIAIDFDAVIHKYSKGWQDGSIYDEHIDGVFEAIRDLMKTNTVFIFSTRSPRQIKRWVTERIMCMEMGDNPHDPQEWTWAKYGYTCKIIPFWVKFWNKENCLGITKRKLPAMVYVDDRALTFRGNWNETMDDILNFKTYQQRK
jgi:hypothetical protein